MPFFKMLDSRNKNVGIHLSLNFGMHVLDNYSTFLICIYRYYFWSQVTVALVTGAVVPSNTPSLMCIFLRILEAAPLQNYGDFWKTLMLQRQIEKRF